MKEKIKKILQQNWFKITIRLLYCLVILLLIWLTLILETIHRGEGISKILQWLGKLNWAIIVAGISTFFTAIATYFISLQYSHNKLINMPKVGFVFISGTTYRKYKQKDNRELDLRERLQTHYMIKNKSGFPIWFWLKGYLEIKYNNGEVKNIRNAFDWKIPIYPDETMWGRDMGKTLYKAIMNKNLTDGEIEELNKKNIEDFDRDMKSRIENIENIGAYITILYAPFHKKDLQNTVMQHAWGFKFKEEKVKGSKVYLWNDPRGINDEELDFSNS